MTQGWLKCAANATAIATMSRDEPPLECEPDASGHRMVVDSLGVEYAAVGGHVEESIADIERDIPVEVEGDAGHQRRDGPVLLVELAAGDAIADAGADIGLDHGIHREIDITIEGPGEEPRAAAVPTRVRDGFIDPHIGAEHRAPFVADAAADDYR